MRSSRRFSARTFVAVVLSAAVGASTLGIAPLGRAGIAAAAVDAPVEDPPVCVQSADDEPDEGLCDIVSDDAAVTVNGLPGSGSFLATISGSLPACASTGGGWSPSTCYYGVEFPRPEQCAYFDLLAEVLVKQLCQITSTSAWIVDQVGTTPVYFSSDGPPWDFCNFKGNFNTFVYGGPEGFEWAGIGAASLDCTMNVALRPDAMRGPTWVFVEAIVSIGEGSGFRTDRIGSWVSLAGDLRADYAQGVSCEVASQSGRGGSIVTFRDTSQGLSGAPVTSWELPDGSTATGDEITVVATEAGPLEVTIRTTVNSESLVDVCIANVRGPAVGGTLTMRHADGSITGPFIDGEGVTFELALGAYDGIGEAIVDVTLGDEFTDNAAFDLVGAASGPTQDIRLAMGETSTITWPATKTSSNSTMTSVIVSFTDASGASPGAVVVEAVGGVEFNDLSRGSFYEVPVAWAFANGITTGTSRTAFSPGDSVTRWQMALFLQRLARHLGLDVSSASVPFTDTAGLSSETLDAIGFLARVDITTGTSPTTYDPFGGVTRWQMALFLQRLATFAGLDTSALADTFEDTSGKSTATREAIGWLQAAGITTGTSPTTFSPDQVVTRAQMVAFLQRIAVLVAGRSI